MQILTTKNVYDIEKDETSFDFLELLRNPPDGLMVQEGNAGLGADWPAGVWTSLNAMAIALAIFNAPSTIEENWPRWKAIYDSVVEQVIERHGDFSIDRDSAQLIAMHYAASELGLMPERLNVHMAIRHFFTTVAGFEDLLKTKRHVMDWSQDGEFGSEEFSNGVRSNEEAARQAICRYIFGITDDRTCFTIVIERDGSISFERDLNMSKDWG